MKSYILGLLFVTMSAMTAFSQIDFKLGDSQLENELNQINCDAKKDLEKFKSDIRANFNVTPTKISEYLEFLQPAEIELAGRIGVIIGKPIDNVITSYRANKEKGWGELAKEMGIKPGSPEFHALKGKTKGGKGNSGSSKGKAKGKSK